jgi:hypothetical protein
MWALVMLALLALIDRTLVIEQASRAAWGARWRQVLAGKAVS